MGLIDSLTRELEGKSKALMSLQAVQDQLQYQLNEHITLTSQQGEELANLTTVVADYERRLVKEHGESERRQRDCDLMQRAKE